MTAHVLFILTFVNEFRYVSVKHEIKVVDGKSQPVPLDDVQIH